MRGWNWMTLAREVRVSRQACLVGRWREDRNQDCLCIVKIAGLVVTISTPGKAAVDGDGSSSMVVTARLKERSDLESQGRGEGMEVVRGYLG